MFAEGLGSDPDSRLRRKGLGQETFWRDHVLFYEYFNGDTGAGLGASHQTGWTALVANLIQDYGGKG